MIHKKNPLGSTAGEGKNGRHTNPIPRQRECQFLPPRFRSQLPELRDPRDVELAVSYRGGIRRAINKGLPQDASRWAKLAAKLVERRALGGGA